MQGLSDIQAKTNNKKYGLNLTAKKERFFLLKSYVRSLLSPLVLLLLGASLISASLGDVKDFIIIFLMVFLSASVSFIQHFRADQEAERLAKRVHLLATVIRDGKKQDIPFSHVTVDDLVFLSAGDIIPADGELKEGKDVSIDESVLTGESLAVSKEAKSKILAGTHVVSGEGYMIVTAIGLSTQFGELSKQIAKGKPETAFDAGLKSFSYLVLKLILSLAVVVFTVNAILRGEVLQSLLFSLALAVGLTPELLPVILTITLSRGALRMEKKEVVVKYLPAIQNLGAMDVLCTDKTGTLTESTITLQSWIDEKAKQDDDVLRYGLLVTQFQSGFKNPLENAVLEKKSLVDTFGYTKIDEIPFDFIRKCMSVIVEKNKKQILILRGEPHEVIERLSATTEAKKKLIKQFETLSNKGYRVIAVATKSVIDKKAYEPKDEHGVKFVGFLIFVDPIKKTVPSALTKLEELGITIKILTGDNEFVTRHVCETVGMKVEKILLGHEIDQMTDEALSKAAENTNIFARLTPTHKMRIITALKLGGHRVGFLGDGVNDAPPLKASDAGISVSNGSDIARDSSDIILLRKSLHVLADGVIEGRHVHGNVFKFILMQISSNFGNMTTVAIASVFLPFLPILPVQLLFLDFLYDSSQIMIPSDNVDTYVIQKPRIWDLGLIKKFMFVFGPISSIFDLLTYGILLFIFKATAPLFQTGWFIESLVTQTLIIFAIRTRTVPFFKSKPSIALTVTSLFVLGVGLVLSQTVLRQAFSFVPVPLVFYGFVAVITALYVICVEIAKSIFYSRVTSS